MNIVAKFKSGDKFLEIFYDETPQSPRENDNLGIMVTSHKQYSLGDTQVNTEEEYKEAIKDAKITLPIFMYDHSGISLSTKRTYPFDDKWDAGQLGVIIVSEEKLKEEYSVKKISKEIIERATKVLESEVAVYNQYVSGDVYGFETFKLEKCDHDTNHKIDEDSCWGFYGSDWKENGLFSQTGIKDWKEFEEPIVA